MYKKLIFIFAIIIVFIFIVFGIYKLLNNKERNETPLNSVNNKVETVTSNNGFKAYSLNNINISDANANLIFLDDLDGKGQDELNASVGFSYSFNKFGEHTIKVLELTNDYITISIDSRLAPTKENGGFSLVDKYDKVTIQKNTGICLNVQATDLINGSVYFFYVNQ